MRVQLTYVSNALRYGIPSMRRATFQMPQSVKLRGRRVRINYPDEQGIANDFITCCMIDEYGLGRVWGQVRTILDLGSNVGFFALAARARFPRATIHAYEPNPRTLPYLRDNVAGGGIRVFAEAVGDRDGSVEIVDRGDSNLARTSASPSGAVPLIPLSRAVDRLGVVVDLAKIDCEGAEWDMFRDTAGWKAIRNLRMEYHLWGRHEYQEVKERLAQLGFTVTRHNSSGEWGTVWASRRFVSVSSAD